MSKDQIAWIIENRWFIVCMFLFMYAIISELYIWYLKKELRKSKDQVEMLRLYSYNLE